MTIPLTDSGKGLFEILGKFVHALNTLNTARGTTVAAEVLDAVEQYKLKTDATLDFDRAVASFPRSEAQWRVSGDTLASAIARACQGLLMEFVLADDPTVPRDLTACLEYLIAEMEKQGHYVSGNTVSVTPAAVPGGNGDLGFVFGTKDAKSKQIENALPETIYAEVTSASVSSAVLVATGERAARNKRAENFPAGSGIRKPITPLTVADSLLSNADFEGDTVTAGEWEQPADWIIALSGDAFVSVSTDRTRTVTIAGSPTAGQYWLTFTGAVFGKVLTTSAIPFDASSSELQEILRRLPDFSEVTVSSTGTSPNLTHTITMTGVDDRYAIGTSPPNTFNTGTIAASAGTDSATAIGGRSLEIQIPTEGTIEMQQPVTLEHDTPYVLAFRGTKLGTAIPLTCSIVDSVGGNIVQDHGGSHVSAELTITADSGHVPSIHGMVFSLPVAVTMPVAVKIETDEVGDAIIIDDIILAPAVELYPGGPWGAAIMSGNPPTAGAQWTITVVNNHASDWQLAFDRLFDMAGKRLILPTSGTTLINDNLIA